MFKKILFSLLSILIFELNTHAYSFDTFKKEVTSPFTTNAKYYLLSGSILTTVLVFDGVEDSLGHRIQDDTVEDKPLGNYSTYGDLAGQMVPNALYTLGFYTAYWISDNPEFRKKSILMLKATAYSGLVTSVLKVTIREPRPNGNNRHSFPSGHTASAFAFASIVGAQHEWYWGTLAYLMAGAVGFSRINDNAHRLHDVVGGAVIGLSYGLSLSYLYKPKKKSEHAFYFSPMENGGSVFFTCLF